MSFAVFFSFSMYIYSSEIKSWQVIPLWVLFWFEATVKLCLISNFSKTIWKIIMLFSFYKTVCFSKRSTDNGSSSFAGISYLQKEKCKVLGAIQRNQPLTLEMRCTSQKHESTILYFPATSYRVFWKSNI